MEWQSMETAPKTGEDILGWFKNHACVIRWQQHAPEWINGSAEFWTDGHLRLREPDLWCPITPPEPPE